MRKTVIVAAASLLVFSGCKKDRSCECTSSYSYQFTDAKGVTSGTSGTFEPRTVVYTKTAKSRMRTLCRNTKSVSTTSNENGTSVNTTETKCTIK